MQCLVDHWAYKPYTLVGPPALQLVLVSYGESVTNMNDGTSLKKGIKSVSQIKRVKILV